MIYNLADIEARLPQISSPAAVPSVPPNAPRQGGYATQKARAVLFADKWEAASEGDRNSLAFKHSAQMLRDFDLSEMDGWEIVSDWNRGNTPPLDEKELRAAFDDAKKYAKGGPGSKLNTAAPPTHQRVLPPTAGTDEPAQELAAHFESEISGEFTNIMWGGWPILTDIAQCLTPDTRTILVGGVGGSKSLMLLQALAVWITAGVKATILEMERRRVFHVNRLLAQKTGIAELTKPKWVQANAGTVRRLMAEHKDYINLVGRGIETVPQQFTSTLVGDWLEKRAGEGYRILAVDPVSAMARMREPWFDDDSFMQRANEIANKYRVSLIFIHHGKKGAGHLPDIDNLAGSAAWSRFADAVLWLQAHDEKTSTVATEITPCGSIRKILAHNRTLHLLKTRSAEGMGRRLAYKFESGLTLSELGLICKQHKGEIKP